MFRNHYYLSISSTFILEPVFVEKQFIFERGCLPIPYCTVEWQQKFYFGGFLCQRSSLCLSSSEDIFATNGHTFATANIFTPFPHQYPTSVLNGDIHVDIVRTFPRGIFFQMSQKLFLDENSLIANFDIILINDGAAVVPSSALREVMSTKRSFFLGRTSLT